MSVAEAESWCDHLTKRIARWPRFRSAWLGVERLHVQRDGRERVHAFEPNCLGPNQLLTWHYIDTAISNRTVASTYRRDADTCRGNNNSRSQPGR